MSPQHVALQAHVDQLVAAWREQIEQADLVGSTPRPVAAHGTGTGSAHP